MTPFQARYLRKLLAYRDRPPTIGRLLRTGLRTYAVLFVAFAGLAALSAWALGSTGVAFVAGALYAVVVRDLGNFRSAVRLWPATREVLDWPKLEGLVAADAAPPPPPP